MMSPDIYLDRDWSDRPAPASRLRCRRALAEAMLLRGAGAAVRKIGLLPHGLAPVGDGNYLIDSRLTAAVQVYRQKLWLLQERDLRARTARGVPAEAHGELQPPLLGSA